MASRESSLWKWLSKASLFYGPALHMNRIENKVMSGMPDVEGCLQEKQFWLELKCGDAPARETTKVNIRVEDSQVDFAKNRLNAGGACGFLVKIKKGNSYQVFLLHGACAEGLQKGLTLEEIRALSLCMSKPKPEDIVSLAIDMVLGEWL